MNHEAPSSDSNPFLGDKPGCDIIMKGGITSGVVYPLAVLELARKYRLRNIGGTSAWALASVLTTAGEYGRESGRLSCGSQHQKESLLCS
jgi:hypothetical protein